jgi:hypothetical protein
MERAAEWGGTGRKAVGAPRRLVPSSLAGIY